MAGYDVTVGKDLLPGLLSGQDGLAKLIESVLNQVLEAQVGESLNADRYERHRLGLGPASRRDCGISKYLGYR